MAIAGPNEVGGYNNNFVETPHDRFLCKICLHPCRDPLLTGCCGHNFCKSCLNNAMISAVTCPICQDGEFTTLQNKQADREIRSLHVMCNNKERGCEWQGELNDINNHLTNSDGCQFENVICFNECGKILERQYLMVHNEAGCPRRKVDCLHCHITGEYQFIEGKHKEQCARLPLPCPNKCEVGSVPREDMEGHRKECPLEMVKCEYHNVGCEERILRKRKKEHEVEKMEEHLLLTKLKLARTEDSLASTEARLGSLEVMVHRLINTTSSSNALIESSQWSSHLATMAKIESITQICPVVVKTSSFSGYSKKAGSLSNPFYSYNKGYKMCMCVYPYGIGDGEGTHMSVFLYLVKGPHDDELTWPMKETFKVTLLNQISDCKHLSMTVMFDDSTPRGSACRVFVDRSIGWGKAKFISKKELHKVTPTCQYLKDDCVFLKVSKI